MSNEPVRKVDRERDGIDQLWESMKLTVEASNAELQHPRTRAAALLGACRGVILVIENDYPNLGGRR